MSFDLPCPGVYFSLWSKVDQILCSPILVHFVFSIWRVAVVIIIHIFPSHCPVHLNPLPMPLVMVLLIFQNVTSIGAACIPTSFHWVALPQWHWGRIIENDSRRFVVLIITILHLHCHCPKCFSSTDSMTRLQEGANKALLWGLIWM